MKIYGSYDSVSGALPCIKKEGKLVSAASIEEDFQIVYDDGRTGEGKAGDYILVTTGGELYAYPKEIFEKYFIFVKPM